MYIADADNLLPKFEEPDSFLGYICQGSVWSIQNVGYQPSERERNEVADFLSKTVGLIVPLKVSNAILDLYPDAKLALSIDHCIETDTADKLSFAIAHFLTGCDWPRKKENQEPFYVLLKKQMSRILERLDEPVVEAPDPFCKVEIPEVPQPLPTERMGFCIEPSVRMGKRSPLTNGWFIFRATEGNQPPVEENPMSNHQREIQPCLDEAASLPIPNLAAFSAKTRKATEQLCAQIDDLIAAGQMPDLKQRWESAGPEEKKVIATGMLVGMVDGQGETNAL